MADPLVAVGGALRRVVEGIHPYPAALETGHGHDNANKERFLLRHCPEWGAPADGR